MRASPESITPVLKFGAERCHRAYGFRACAKRAHPQMRNCASGNDDVRISHAFAFSPRIAPEFC